MRRFCVIQNQLDVGITNLSAHIWLVILGDCLNTSALNHKVFGNIDFCTNIRAGTVYRFLQAVCSGIPFSSIIQFLNGVLSVVLGNIETVILNFDSIALNLRDLNPDGFGSFFAICNNNCCIDRSKSSNSSGRQIVKLDFVFGRHQPCSSLRCGLASGKKKVTFVELLYVFQPIQGVGIFLFKCIKQSFCTNFEDNISQLYFPPLQKNIII